MKFLRQWQYYSDIFILYCAILERWSFPSTLYVNEVMTCSSDWSIWLSYATPSMASIAMTTVSIWYLSFHGNSLYFFLGGLTLWGLFNFTEQSISAADSCARLQKKSKHNSLNLSMQLFTVYLHIKTITK